DVMVADAATDATAFRWLRDEGGAPGVRQRRATRRIAAVAGIPAENMGQFVDQDGCEASRLLAHAVGVPRGPDLHPIHASGAFEGAAAEVAVCSRRVHVEGDGRGNDQLLRSVASRL